MEKLIKSILQQYDNDTAGELIRMLFNYIDNNEIKTDNKQIRIIFNIVVKEEADRLIKQREKKKERKKRRNKSWKRL